MCYVGFTLLAALEVRPGHSCKIAHCISEDGHAVGVFSSFPSPVRVVCRVNETFRVRHKTKNATGVITKAGDVVS